MRIEPARLDGWTLNVTAVGRTVDAGAIQDPVTELTTLSGVATVSVPAAVVGAKSQTKILSLPATLRWMTVDAVTAMSAIRAPRPPRSSRPAGLPATQRPGPCLRS